MSKKPDQTDAWKPCWVRGSKIEEIAWIGNDVLAWCAGLCIVFFNIVEKRQRLLWCSDQVVGEGARCISGHSTLPIFAFSEKTHNPRILIYTFPAMTKIADCVRGCSTGYLATAFTARDHVISMGRYPNFPMTIWNWKTGEKILAMSTKMRDDVGQTLRITQVGPAVIAQVGRSCGKLVTWELDIAGKVAVLRDHEVKLPQKTRILGVDWRPAPGEPLLAITDENGHIYLSNHDGSNIHRIVFSQRCGICVDIERPIVCWFHDGIILKTTFCQIRFFKKNPKTGRWKKEWYVKSVSKPCILVTHPFRNDRFYYHTLEGHLMQIDFPEERATPSIERHLRYGAIYRFADFVYPWCHHLAATDDSKELTVLECYSGMEVSKLDIEANGDISSQAAHPDYPLIGLGTLRGELVIASLVDPYLPRVIAHMHLQEQPLDFVKFSYSGRFLIAAEKKSGNCYFVNLHRDKAYTVEAALRAHREIIDVLLYESRGSLKVFVLYVGAKQYSVGQQLLFYDISETQNLVTESTDTLELPGVYNSLWHVPGNPQLLVGSPYLTRQLRVQSIVDFKDTALVDGLATGHQVRLANVFVDRHWITSSAFDGLIFVRDKSVKVIAAVFMAHHRSDFGTVKAMANRACDMVICLGYDGSLVAMMVSNDRKMESTVKSSSSKPEILHRVDYGWYEKQKRRILADYASLDPGIHNLLTRSKLQIPPCGEEEKTWVEWRADRQVEEEARKYEKQRTEILRDFEVLKSKVKELLDANEICPESERLPVSAFDLDKIGRDHKIKAAKDECDDIRQGIEHEIGEKKRVSNWIRDTFWKPQKVIGKSLYSIFTEKEVTNYPLVAEDPEFEDHLRWAQFRRECMSRITESDTFQPWRNYTEEELKEELNKPLKLYREDERRRIDMLLEEEDREADQKDLEEQAAMQGTTTHRFVEHSPYYYSQLESYGFDHATQNNCFLTHDCARLRAYFNKAFEDVYATKEREMSVIRERIEKIRHIDSELHTMFGQRVPEIPVDPDWHWQEKPESIITVLDHEVDAKPYVSPSQQEILDKQAAEEERLRQLLLADDFRERALMVMMDGVLEVRWEDTIKADVPKPRCMLEKKPENYTAEDIVLVKKYEKDCQFLEAERERYRRMLEADYIKINGLLKESIDRFNAKHEDLYRLKMKIEAAINQSNLRYVRGCLRNYRRVKALEEEDRVKEKIVEKLQYETMLADQSQIFQNVRHELVAQHEALCNREKLFLRKFKSEFSSLGKINIQLVEKQYKRRPKTTLKNCTASDFLELGHHVVSHTEPVYLSKECSDYLKVLENLDIRPSALPPAIEESHWQQLINLRRLKIDLELKTRSKQAEVVEIESLIAAFDGRIDKCRSDVNDMRKKIEEMRRDRTIYEQDAEVQLVLKMGQVEIDLRGDLDDAANAILIPSTEIDAVNDLIRGAGECKLEALKKTMSIQRGTQLKEWEHECLKKRLEDLQEDLRFTRSITVTKEMQAYLKREARGLKDDKTPQHLERQLETTKARHERIVEEHLKKLADIHREIAITRSKNEQLDREIMELNVDRCEMEQQRDLIAEARQRGCAEERIRMVMARSDLIKQIQDNYAEILALETEHELLKQRRYPMLRFKTLDEDVDKRNAS